MTWIDSNQIVLFFYPTLSSCESRVPGLSVWPDSANLENPGKSFVWYDHETTCTQQGLGARGPDLGRCCDVIWHRNKLCKHASQVTCPKLSWTWKPWLSGTSWLTWHRGTCLHVLCALSLPWLPHHPWCTYRDSEATTHKCELLVPPW